MKSKNIIFNNVLIAKNKIRNIKIKPYTKNSIPLPGLEIIIKFDNGDQTVCYVKIATAKDVKNKFGTYTKTYWHTEKGLFYDDAEDAFNEVNYSDVLFAIQNILNDEEASVNGDILSQLHELGVFDKYKEEYLSLIRETTDEEYELMQKEYDLNVNLDKLANTYENDEDTRQSLYSTIKSLYKDVYRKEAPSIETLIECYKENKRMIQYIGRRYD